MDPGRNVESSLRIHSIDLIELRDVQTYESTRVLGRPRCVGLDHERGLPWCQGETNRKTGMSWPRSKAAAPCTCSAILLPFPGCWDVLWGRKAAIQPVSVKFLGHNTRVDMRSRARGHGGVPTPLRTGLAAHQMTARNGPK